MRTKMEDFLIPADSRALPRQSAATLLKQMANDARALNRAVPANTNNAAQWQLALRKFQKKNHNRPQVFNGPAEEREFISQAFTMARWAEYGCNSFLLSESLASAFALTDIDIDDQCFNLPFPSLVVRIPPGIIPLRPEAGAEKEWVRIICFHTYVAARNGFEFDESRPISELPTTSMEPFFWQDCITASGLRIWSSSSVREIISDGFPTDFYAPRDGLENLDTDQASADCARRIGFNLFRWLDSVGKKSAHVRKMTATSNATTWQCGGDIPITTDLRSSIAAMNDDGASSTMKRLIKSHIVRGHWRLQACGPQLSERKRIFIAPFWKGPSDKEAWERIYRVSE